MISQNTPHQINDVIAAICDDQMHSNHNKGVREEKEGDNRNRTPSQIKSSIDDVICGHEDTIRYIKLIAICTAWHNS